MSLHDCTIAIILLLLLHVVIEEIAEIPKYIKK